MPPSIRDTAHTSSSLFPRLSACWSDIIFLPGARADNSEQRGERKSITLPDKKLLLPAIRISLPTFILCLLFTPLPPSSPRQSRAVQYVSSDEKRRSTCQIPSNLAAITNKWTNLGNGRRTNRKNRRGGEESLVSSKRKGGGVARKRKVGAKSVLGWKWAAVTRDTGV